MPLPVSPVTGRVYGALRDIPDTRNFKLAPSPAPKVQSFTNAAYLGAVKDQGQLGSCTGNAYAGIREFLARKYESKSPALSALFVYYMERKRENTLPADNGAMPKSGCIVLNQDGVCEENIDPYLVANFDLPPTPLQLENSLLWKAGAYHQVEDLNSLLTCIASGYCVSVGFTVYDSFESDKTAKTGIVTLPQSREKILGGHETYAYGFDLTSNNEFGVPGVFIRNSWGTGWGKNGNCIFPLAMFEDFDFVSDMWLIHLGKAWK